MNPAEVVIGEPQADCRPVVLPFHTEAVRQAGEAPNLHPHRQVLALHVGCANAVFFGVSHDWDLLRTNDFGGTVPALIVLRRSVNLDVLRIVATVA